jgi:trypsin
MYYIVASYLTNRFPVSNIQLRAGSSIVEFGGTLHAVDQIIVHPSFNTQTTDFDVAVAKVSDNVLANLNF